MLLTCDTVKYILGSVYIPPNSNLLRYVRICDSIEQLQLAYPGYHSIILYQR